MLGIFNLPPARYLSMPSSLPYGYIHGNVATLETYVTLLSDVAEPNPQKGEVRGSKFFNDGTIHNETHDVVGGEVHHARTRTLVLDTLQPVVLQKKEDAFFSQHSSRLV